MRYGHQDFGRLQRCGCLDAALVAARAQLAAARAAQLTAQLADELGALARCTLDSIDRRRPLTDILWGGQAYPVAEQRLMLSRACGIARDYRPPEHLYLYGPPGGAKSHLAAAILNAQAQRGVGGRYGSMPALLRLLRRGFSDGTADARLEALMDAELLVIDDLGVEQGSDWADAQLFDLINVRLAGERATIITSNLAPDQHRDARIASRLQGSFTPIRLILSDYRAVQAQQRSA